MNKLRLWEDFNDLSAHVFVQKWENMLELTTDIIIDFSKCMANSTNFRDKFNSKSENMIGVSIDTYQKKKNIMDADKKLEHLNRIYWATFPFHINAYFSSVSQYLDYERFFFLSLLIDLLQLHISQYDPIIVKCIPSILFALQNISIYKYHANISKVIYLLRLICEDKQLFPIDTEGLSCSIIVIHDYLLTIYDDIIISFLSNKHNCCHLIDNSYDSIMLAGYFVHITCVVRHFLQIDLTEKIHGMIDILLHFITKVCDKYVAATILDMVSSDDEYLLLFLLQLHEIELVSAEHSKYTASNPVHFHVLGLDTGSCLCYFIFAILCRDVSVFIDLLCSPETVSLKYLLRITKYFCTYELNTTTLLSKPKQYSTTDLNNTEDINSNVVIWMQDTRYKNERVAKDEFEAKEMKPIHQSTQASACFDLKAITHFFTELAARLDSMSEKGMLPFEPSLIIRRICILASKMKA